MTTYGAYSADQVEKITPKQIAHGVPGVSASGTLGFYGVSPIAQRSGATQATVTGTIVNGTGGFGFATTTTITNLLAFVQEVQYTLTALGLWKGGS